MLRAVLSLALSAVVVFATASVVVRLVSDERIPSGTRVTGLTWSDRVFTSKREFAEFLTSKGVAYEDWAERHPGAAPWQRNSSPADAAAADDAGRAVPPAEPAAREATGRARRSSEAAAEPRDGLGSRLAPAALVLAAVTLLVLTARRVRLRPAVVALPAAGPALAGPRDSGPARAMLPPATALRASATAVAGAPPLMEIAPAAPPAGAASPRRRLGSRLRGIVSVGAAAARSGAASVAQWLAGSAAALARAFAAAPRAVAAATKRKAPPRRTKVAPARALASADGTATRTGPPIGARWFAAVAAALTGAVAAARRPPPLARKPESRRHKATVAAARPTRVRIPPADWVARAAARAARAPASAIEMSRSFLRARSFNALDAATYSLAVVAAAGIGVLIAFLAGP